MCAHASFYSSRRIRGFQRVPMQNLLFLARLKAWGVCACEFLLLLAKLKALGAGPWKTLLLLANRRHRACTHAEFSSIRKAEGIGCLPMLNFINLAEMKALGVSPCKIDCFWQN